VEGTGEVRRLNGLPFLISQASPWSAYGDRVEGEHPDTLALSQGQYDALVSVTYNEGAGRLQSSTLTPGWSATRTLPPPWRAMFGLPVIRPQSGNFESFHEAR
jgi:Phage lysozyme